MSSLAKSLVAYKVYQTMFRVVKESETVDARQHCFLLQSSGHDPRYLSVETRQELLRIETSWNAAIITSVIKLGVSEMLYAIVEYYIYLKKKFFVYCREKPLLFRTTVRAAV